MERILNSLRDPGTPIDVALLDSIVNALYDSRTPPQERSVAQDILTQFKEHPNSWLHAATILEQSKSNARFLALQVLESTIKTRWKQLPREQCDQIKGYIINLVMKLASDPKMMQSERLYINKLDVILVQILKQEWPDNWHNFIPEIVAASGSNETVCENTMQIFRFLSEEVWDYSSKDITRGAVAKMRQTFQQEFTLIFQLCQHILLNSANTALIQATLTTLPRFIPWMPHGYVFETELISLLVTKFLPASQFRNAALQCLTDIAGMDPVGVQAAYPTQIEKLFLKFMGTISQIAPLGRTDFKELFDGSDSEQQFVNNTAQFFATILKCHLRAIFERKLQDFQQAILTAHEYLIELTKALKVSEAPESFRTRLEYWHFLTGDIYSSERNTLGSGTRSPRHQFYAPILSKLRDIVISNMTKPEEVVIVQNEDGDVVREETGAAKDENAVQLHKSMQETLQLLGRLDITETVTIAMNKLNAQASGAEKWSWRKLNVACWSLGALSGVLPASDEDRFFSPAMKTLLQLYDSKQTVNNRAIIASNILFLAGAFPQCLQINRETFALVISKMVTHWMQDKFPGIQDMVCDVLLKIAKKCPGEFAKPISSTSSRSLIEELLEYLPQVTSNLDHPHVCSFFEAVGYMINRLDSQHQGVLVAKLMERSNQKLIQIMQQAQQSVDVLKVPDVVKELGTIFELNARVAHSLGARGFLLQLQFFDPILQIYKVYNQTISAEVLAKGAVAVEHANVRAMRKTKREALGFVEEFIRGINDSGDDDIKASVLQSILPPLLDAILADYQTSLPNARNPAVLSVLTAAIEKLPQGSTNGFVGRILDAVLEPTLSMLAASHDEFSDHRANFFALLHAIIKNCFAAVVVLPANVVQIIIEALLFAMRHTNNTISELGITALVEFLRQIDALKASNPSQAHWLYQALFVPALREVVRITTDAAHTSGFRLQSQVLQQLLRVAQATTHAPVFDVMKQYPGIAVSSNQDFVKQFLTSLLTERFPDLTSEQVQQFVTGLINATNVDEKTFGAYLRSFLLGLKNFEGMTITEWFDYYE